MTEVPEKPYPSEKESLNQYLQEVEELEQLTVEEEAALARRIKKGDREALVKLTKANLRLVINVARKYQNQGLSLGDLINEGNQGLIKAGKRFDETKGFRFGSYAVWWIRQAILQALAEQSKGTDPRSSNLCWICINKPSEPV